MNTDKKLAHFVLQTGQLPALRDWYLTVLDAHIVYENQFLSLMTFDEEHHRLGIVQLPQPVKRTPMTVGLAIVRSFCATDGFTALLCRASRLPDYVIDSVYLSHTLSLADDLRLSTRFSMRSAPRATPPVAARPAATRRAPSVMLIA